jgi:hypothetical protein
MMLEFLSRVARQEKEIKGTHVGKELINTFDKIAGYTINLQDLF